MRISDWSSDVCSSDLLPRPRARHRVACLVGIAPVTLGCPCFPTTGRFRCSSGACTLRAAANPRACSRLDQGLATAYAPSTVPRPASTRSTGLLAVGRYARVRSSAHWRSEEHTSELQSLMRSSYDVFCLKNKTHKNTKKIHTTIQN